MVPQWAHRWLFSNGLLGIEMNRTSCGRRNPDFEKMTMEIVALDLNRQFPLWIKMSLYRLLLATPIAIQLERRLLMVFAFDPRPVICPLFQFKNRLPLLVKLCLTNKSRPDWTQWFLLQCSPPRQFKESNFPFNHFMALYFYFRATSQTVCFLLNFVCLTVVQVLLVWMTIILPKMFLQW